jgi:hypothetical protein
MRISFFTLLVVLPVPNANALENFNCYLVNNSVSFLQRSNRDIDRPFVPDMGGFGGNLRQTTWFYTLHPSLSLILHGVMLLYKYFVFYYR